MGKVGEQSNRKKVLKAFILRKAPMHIFRVFKLSTHLKHMDIFSRNKKVEKNNTFKILHFKFLKNEKIT